MRVLIVNGFPPTPKGQDEMEEFKAGILKGFEEPYNKYLTSVAFAVREKNNLKDFLYDSTTEFIDRASLRSFKALDMVFIGGDSNLLPWLSSVRQVNILMKMCLRASKPTFCSSFAMQMLACLCRVGGEPICVFNGRGRGGPLAGLKEMPEQVTMHLRETDLFLDAATGDLYRKSGQDIVGDFQKYKDVGVFDPASENTGLPVSPARRPEPLESRQSQRSAAPPVPYRPDHRQEKGAWNMEPVGCGRNETVAEVLDPRNLQHWALRSLPKSFLVPCPALWQCLPPRPPLEMLLASRTRGPQVVLLGPILGIQFPIRRKFPETEAIVRNWIHVVSDRSMHAGEAGMGRCPDVLGPEIMVGLSGPSKWEERLREEQRRERHQLKEGMRGRGDDRNRTSAVNLWAPTAGRPGSGVEEEEDRENRDGLEVDIRPNSSQSFIDVPLTMDMAPQMDPPRAFTRAEIRKMLHPEIDITDVEPLVPLKVMRCGSSSKKKAPFYNRWKYSNSAGFDGEYVTQFGPGEAGSGRPQSTPPGVGGLGRPVTRAKTAPAMTGGGLENPGFFRFPGIASTTMGRQVKNYVQQTAGPFPLDHQFRPKSNKENWKSSSDFVPAGNFGGWGMGLPVAKDPSAPNAAVKAYQNKRLMPG